MPCQAAIPLVMAAAGTGMQMAANAQSQREMNKKVQQELAKQAQFQTQANAAYQQSLGQSTPEVAAQQTQAGAQSRQGAYEQAQAVPLSQSSAAPAMTGTQQLSQQAATGQSNVARSQYMGQEDWLLQQLIKNIRAQQQMGLISNMARGSQNVMPFEVQDARYAGQGLRTAGQGLGAAASLASMGSLCSPSTAPLPTVSPVSFSMSGLY